MAKRGLWRILQDYIYKNRITYVWSLLPSSLQYPYHQVFKELWKALRSTGVKCIHVKVSKAGSGTGIKRAEWLKYIIESNSLHLVYKPSPSERSKQIPNYTFQYLPC